MLVPVIVVVHSVMAAETGSCAENSSDKSSTAYDHQFTAIFELVDKLKERITRLEDRQKSLEGFFI